MWKEFIKINGKAKHLKLNFHLKRLTKKVKLKRKLVDKSYTYVQILFISLFAISVKKNSGIIQNVKKNHKLQTLTWQRLSMMFSSNGRACHLHFSRPDPTRGLFISCLIFFSLHLCEIFEFQPFCNFYHALQNHRGFEAFLEDRMSTHR